MILMWSHWKTINPLHISKKLSDYVSCKLASKIFRRMWPTLCRNIHPSAFDFLRGKVKEIY